MKKTTFRLRLASLAGAFAFLPLCVSFAADTNSVASEVPTVQTTPAPVISTAPAAVKLPYGVEDVLKLSRAQIGEEIILNYVQNSGTIYNLGPREIVYLRDQGVSDKVVNAMLAQRKRVEIAAQNPALQAPAVPNAAGVADENAVPSAPTYADPNVTYAQAPLTPPASSVYTIPYAGVNPYYGPYGPYPYNYYYPYYGGWYGPGIAFGFGFGGHGGFHGHGSYAHGSGGHHH